MLASGRRRRSTDAPPGSSSWRSRRPSIAGGHGDCAHGPRHRRRPAAPRSRADAGDVGRGPADLLRRAELRRRARCRPALAGSLATSAAAGGALDARRLAPERRRERQRRAPAPAPVLPARGARRSDASGARSYRAFAGWWSSPRRTRGRCGSSTPTLALEVVPERGRRRAHVAEPEVAREAGLVVFIGAMQWPPNAEAAVFLARESCPSCARSEPEARLAIVGRNPGPEVRALGPTRRRRGHRRGGGRAAMAMARRRLRLPDGERDGDQEQAARGSRLRHAERRHPDVLPGPRRHRRQPVCSCADGARHLPRRSPACCPMPGSRERLGRAGRASRREAQLGQASPAPTSASTTRYPPRLERRLRPGPAAPALPRRGRLASSGKVSSRRRCRRAMRSTRRTAASVSAIPTARGGERASSIAERGPGCDRGRRNALR